MVKNSKKGEKHQRRKTIKDRQKLPEGKVWRHILFSKSSFLKKTFLLE